ncbi:MAG: hypothetical protein IPM48_05750 [Saprospiraceae bacterium]|nr:hypothetical protein [Saprospiraceae bacterium]
MKEKLFCAILILIGQFAVAQDYWEWVDSPPIGLVNSFVLDKDGRMYQAVCDRIYYSDDHGSSWEPTQFYFDNCFPSTLAINKDGFLFASTISEGIYRSADRGQTWKHLTNGLPACCIQSIAFNSAGHIFVGSRTMGIYISKDKGESWTEFNAGLLHLGVSVIRINDKDHIFAGTDQGIVYRFTQQGSKWFNINRGLKGDKINDLAINSKGHLFLGTNKGELYRSTNNGDQWTQCLNNSAFKTSSIRSIVINRFDDIYIGSPHGVLRSTDNAQNWTWFNQGLTNTYVCKLGINARDQILAGIEIGVFRTNSLVSSTKELSTLYPKNFVEQNSPNPFSSTTQIPIYLMRGDRMTVDILDEFGRTIDNLRNEPMVQGRQMIEWNAESHPPGIYYCRVRAADFIQTIKLIVVK